MAMWLILMTCMLHWRAVKSACERLFFFAGRDLLVQWKNGSTEWIHLKALMNSNPLKVAEYAKWRGIDNQPAFVWWVSYTLWRRDRIIVCVNSRVKWTTHKYGIVVPRMVEEELKIDRVNGDSYWWKAIIKEMENLKKAFGILPKVSKLL